MKKLVAAVLLAGVATLGATAADAADGCGRGYHEGPGGRCRPNNGYRGGREVVVAPGLIVGNYYRDRGGYWDGRRYWRERYRYHGGWRYR